MSNSVHALDMFIPVPVSLTEQTPDCQQQEPPSPLIHRPSHAVWQSQPPPVCPVPPVHTSPTVHITLHHAPTNSQYSIHSPLAPVALPTVYVGAHTPTPCLRPTPCTHTPSATFATPLPATTQTATPRSSASSRRTRARPGDIPLRTHTPRASHNTP